MEHGPRLVCICGCGFAMTLTGIGEDGKVFGRVSPCGRCNGTMIDRCEASYVCSHCAPNDPSECLGGPCPEPIHHATTGLLAGGE